MLWGSDRPESQFPWIDPNDPGKKRPDRPPKWWEVVACLLLLGMAAGMLFGSLLAKLLNRGLPAFVMTVLKVGGSLAAVMIVALWIKRRVPPPRP